MARTTRTHAATAVADAQALPLADGCLDVALFLHMLYHVPDPTRAVRELRRVVRPTGTVLVAVNGPGHIAEVNALFTLAARTVAGTTVNLAGRAARFDTDAARETLAAAFDDITVQPAGGSCAVPDPAVLSGYLASWPPEALGLTAGPVWTAILAEADRLIEAHYATRPTFVVTSRADLLLAR